MDVAGTPLAGRLGGAGSGRRLAERTLWWLFVGAATASFALAFARGWGSAALFPVGFALFAVLFGLERALPRWRQPPVWRDPQFWNDAGHNLLGQGVGNFLGDLFVLFAMAALAGWLGESYGARLWPVAWPHWVQVGVLVLLADGLDYGRHRLLHTVAWLWPIHAVHHSVDRLHILKAGRNHPLDMLLRHGVVFAPLAASGVPTEVLLWYPAAVSIVGPIAHANVAVRLPAMIHRLVVTPQVHHIHHARPLDLSMSNFANLFPLWDMVFGTFRYPDEPEGLAFGIEQDPLPTSFSGQLLAPFGVHRTRPDEMLSPNCPLRRRAR